MLRLLVVVSCLVAPAMSAASAESMKFCTKMSTVVLNPSFLKPADSVKCTDIVFKQISQKQTMDQISDGLIGSMLGCLPLPVYFKAIALQSSCDSCLKNGGSKQTTLGLLNKSKPGLTKGLKKIYNSMITTVNGMASKTQAQKMASIYNTGCSALTKDLVQHIMDFINTDFEPIEWSCALTGLKDVIIWSLYKTAKIAKKSG